jgi:hypothetical protein
MNSQQTKRRTAFTLWCVCLVCTSMMLELGAAPATAALAERPPQSWGANGRVYTVLRFKKRVYIGGAFTAVRSPRGQFVPRRHVAALNARTGALVRDWRPVVDGAVHALATSPDRKKVYAGGSFRHVNGMRRRGLAALLTKGGVSRRFKANTNFPVRSLVRRKGRLYVGGAFTRISHGGRGLARRHLAAVGTGKGRIIRRWRAKANATVKTLKLHPSRSTVYAGGNFTKAKGRFRRRLAAFTGRKGRLRRWNPTTLQNLGRCGNGCVLDLAIRKGRVFAGVGGKRGNRVAAFTAKTGRQLWARRGNGDVHTVEVRGRQVLVGGHFTRIGASNRNWFITYAARNGARRTNFTPTFNKPIWDIDSVPENVYMGGDFTRVSGTTRVRYARFRRR